MVPDVEYNSRLVSMGALKSVDKGPGNEIRASEVDDKSRELQVATSGVESRKWIPGENITWIVIH